MMGKVAAGSGFWWLLMLMLAVCGGCGADRTTYQRQTTAETVAKLTFCGDDRHRDVSRRLLFVSTLDGSVTALDLSAAGAQRWSLRTGPAPLLSSSIHRFELTNDGRMVRMIPSLYGSLYKFDGESIEQIPVTADHLLSSSYKFSEDLVISGGKETRSYGVSARTGRVVYECSIAGCRNHTELVAEGTASADDEGADLRHGPHGPPRREFADSEDGDESPEHDPLVDDIVVVRRETQTVRAVEPRTGGERWNFSVGHHQLELLQPPDCWQTRLDDADDAEDDATDANGFDGALKHLELRVLVPEGVVCAVRRDDPRVVVWRHKFEHPIVNAWRVSGRDRLQPVNLFGAQQFPVKQQQSPPVGSGGGDQQLQPSVYVGMYQRQLYIQESERLRKQMQTQQLDAINRNYLKIPWRPQYALVGAENGVVEEEANTATTTTQTTEAAVWNSVIDVNDDRATALSVLYATEYVNGNGFFLYSSADLNRTSRTCDRQNGSHEGGEGDAGHDNGYEFPFDDDDTPTKIIIVSLWFWWKEIMVISLTTALILNVVLSRRLTSPREVVIVERHVEIQVPVPTATEAIASEESAASTRRSLSESQHSDSAQFVSRYQADFDMLQCLGKGGFGVVFESKNKLDDCRYAIKRIQLPNRPESRDRVMREVKTLAHCEHQNIVRYFQAWVETPPAGWQEKEDRIWMDREALSHSVDIESPTLDDEETSSVLPSRSQPQQVVFSKVINRRGGGLDSWIGQLNTNECLNFDDNNRKTSFVDDETQDDSFIQFRSDASASAAADCSYCGDSVFSDGQRRRRNGARSTAEDSVNIVFSDETQSRAPRTSKSQSSFSRSVSAATGVSNGSDSFRIEFRNPSATLSGRSGSTGTSEEEADTTSDSTEEGEEEDEDEDTTNNTSNQVDWEDDEVDDDSFCIEFKHSTNGGGGGGDGDQSCASRCGAAGDCSKSCALPPTAVRIAKQRTISENIATSASGLQQSEDSQSAAAAPSADMSNAAVNPFRRTHRRPLSLDLTAASRQRQRLEAATVAANNRMYLYIQMQLCKKQSLKDWLRLNDSAARQPEIVNIFRQIVDGVEYCHLKGLIHRDLKPSNIFFALDGQIKIGDFGLVTGMADMPSTPCAMRGGVGLAGAAGGGGGCAKHTQQVGTQLYMSPEQLRGEQYSYKVDVYSLGLIFFELLRVFGTEMERIETLKALRLGAFPRDFALEFADEFNLLRLMLSQSPDERPTTIGIRARPPLGEPAAPETETCTDWHFRLPPRRRDSQLSGGGFGAQRSVSESESNAAELVLVVPK